MKKTFIFLFSLTSFTLIFCSSSSAQSDTTLYKRIGGKDAITMLGNDFLANMVSDSRINKRFARADVKALIINWDSIICNKTGGNCRLPTNLQKPKLTDSEWAIGIENITNTLDKFRVPKREALEFIAVLNALRKDYFTK
jgi:hemoglobin